MEPFLIGSWAPNLCARSVPAATIAITLYWQSFYNLRHTPKVQAFEGSSSSAFPSLRVPHPLICQQADTHRRCGPTPWSITDGGLAIVIAFLPEYLASLFSAPPTEFPSKLATTTADAILPGKTALHERANDKCYPIFFVEKCVGSASRSSIFLALLTPCGMLNDTFWTDCLLALVVLQNATLLLTSQFQPPCWAALVFFIFLSAKVAFMCSHGTVRFLPSLLNRFKFWSFRMNIWIVFRVFASTTPSAVYRAGSSDAHWCRINWGGGCAGWMLPRTLFALKMEQKSTITSWAAHCQTCWYRKHWGCSIDLRRIL